jgi:hypothetical protein
MRDDIQEFCSAGWGKDVLLALRQFRRAPSFGLVVVMTLAVGIGGTTAMFSFVNALLLRPFPFPNPDQLVEVYAFNGSEKTRLSIREVNDLNEQADDAPAEHLLITRRTNNLFQVLGVAMEVGNSWPDFNDRSRSFRIVLNSRTLDPAFSFRSRNRRTSGSDGWVSNHCGWRRSSGIHVSFACRPVPMLGDRS